MPSETETDTLESVRHYIDIQVLECAWRLLDESGWTFMDEGTTRDLHRMMALLDAKKLLGREDWHTQ